MPPELRHRDAGLHEQCSAGPGPGLREPLGDRHAEGEPGVDEPGAEVVGRGGAALPDRVEPRVAGVPEALFDGAERAAVEQVGRVHGVPRLPQVVGERAHAVGQALDVVVEQHLGHVAGLPRQ
jgi:hypothetical protein